MKTTKLIAAAIITMIVLAGSAFAGNNYEVKFKSTVTTMAGKDKVETIVNMLKGVKEATLNMDDKVICVKYNSEEITPEMVEYTIKCIGYEVTMTENKEVQQTSENESQTDDKKLN
jgi:cation transport ATPase